MDNVKQTLIAIRWFLAVGRKFLRVAPHSTIAVVLSTIVSQVSTILVFFLPLKIIILMGSTRVPRYFPQSWADYDRDLLIFFLCLAMLLFFMTHLLAEKVIKTFVDKGAFALLDKTAKFVLFDNQEEKAAKAYSLYSESAAALVFIFLALVLLTYLYPLLFAGIIAFILVVAIALSLAVSFSSHWKYLWDEKNAEICKTLSTVGFFCSFLVIVAHFLKGTPPGFFVVIVGMLLARQSLSRLATFIKNLKALYLDRVAINALFFHHHVYVPDNAKHTQSFWELMEIDEREIWIRNFLQRLGKADFSSMDIAWFQTGIHNVGALIVSLRNDNDRVNAKYLIKVFGPNRKALALNESSLLNVAGDKFPAPMLLGSESVGDCFCHLFDWSDIAFQSPENSKENVLNIRKTLMLAHVPEHLIKRYGRSKQFIWQRLDMQIPQRMKLTANTESEHYAAREFARKLPGMLQLLRAMPVQFINPNISSYVLAQDARQNSLLWHWGQWSLEPLGASWPVDKAMLEKLADALNEFHLTRPECRDTTVAQIKFSALIFELEKLFIRQNFMGLFTILPDLMQFYDLAQSQATNEKNGPEALELNNHRL